MAFTEADNLAITRTELDEVFYQSLSQRSNFPGYASVENGKLFKVTNTEHSALIGEVFKPTGMWGQIGEIDPIPEESPRVSNKYVIPVLDFADSINISKNLFDDNMHDVWASAVRDFSMMANVTRDSNGFGLFRNAFTTTLTPDGVAWISSGHVTLAGSTVSNLVTGALTPTTLNAAVVRLMEMKAQNGVVMGTGTEGLILLVPPALFKLATEITDSVLVSDASTNAVNVFRSALGIEVMTSAYLGAAAGGSDTAWFLLSAGTHSASRLVRQGVTTALRNWMYSNNRTYNYQGNYRESYFVRDYFGAVGSAG